MATKTTGVFTIGQDVELKSSKAGNSYAIVSMATRTGQNGDETTWYRVSMFGKRAESLAPHLTKGVRVLAELVDVKASAYTNKNGEVAASLEAKLDGIEFISKPKRDGDQGGQTPTRAPNPRASRADDGDEITF
ncbi:single-stranded DNA-binding protein [Sinimarinibacterium sp. NLF-5-8]|uniref:single-stranded DNA-binding protein n=1 Tax=Sinimarinibacterium sp. NLF-5-8 TaxID=2698684 RepID=UPI00137BE024|nr:single-stranded DNA-binding protein [Sinimarinibacterium sp. NLF-5-8]QHS09010.1 single-stranded DNA-binding protein [Sinimarinibacterium sp. NLF-5-8]